MMEKVNLDLEYIKKEIGDLYLQVIYLKQENERLRDAIRIKEDNKPKLVKTDGEGD